jgi:hypothetical protein
MPPRDRESLMDQYMSFDQCQVVELGYEKWTINSLVLHACEPKTSTKITLIAFQNLDQNADKHWVSSLKYFLQIFQNLYLCKIPTLITETCFWSKSWVVTHCNTNCTNIRIKYHVADSDELLNKFNERKFDGLHAFTYLFQIQGCLFHFSSIYLWRSKGDKSF